MYPSDLLVPYSLVFKVRDLFFERFKVLLVKLFYLSSGGVHSIIPLKTLPVFHVNYTDSPLLTGIIISV